MIRRAFLALSLMAVLVAGPADARAQAAAATVSAQDDEFKPATITVSAGTKLTWHNDGAEQHTVTADNGMFDSGNRDPGDSFDVLFDTPGTYAYYCSIHGGPNGDGMSGVVVVN